MQSDDALWLFRGIFASAHSLSVFFPSQKKPLEAKRPRPRVSNLGSYSPHLTSKECEILEVDVSSPGNRKLSLDAGFLLTYRNGNFNN